MPAKSSAASGAQTWLLAMPSQSTQSKVSPPKCLDHRRLPSVVESCLPGRIKGRVSKPARTEEGSGEARHGVQLCVERSSSSAKSSRGSLLLTSARTRPKGCDLTSRSIISLNSRRPKGSAVQRAILSCSAYISHRTPGSAVLTGWTTPTAR